MKLVVGERSRSKCTAHPVDDRGGIPFNGEANSPRQDRKICGRLGIDVAGGLPERRPVLEERGVDRSEVGKRVGVCVALGGGAQCVRHADRAAVPTGGDSDRPRPESWTGKVVPGASHHRAGTSKNPHDGCRPGACLGQSNRGLRAPRRDGRGRLQRAVARRARRHRRARGSPGQPQSTKVCGPRRASRQPGVTPRPVREDRRPRRPTGGSHQTQEGVRGPLEARTKWPGHPHAPPPSGRARRLWQSSWRAAGAAARYVPDPGTARHRPHGTSVRRIGAELNPGRPSLPREGQCQRRELNAVTVRLVEISPHRFSTSRFGHLPPSGGVHAPPGAPTQEFGWCVDSPGPPLPHDAESKATMTLISPLMTRLRLLCIARKYPNDRGQTLVPMVRWPRNVARRRVSLRGTRWFRSWEGTQRSGQNLRRVRRPSYQFSSGKPVAGDARRV